MQKIIPFHYFDGNFSMSDIKIIYIPQAGQVTPKLTYTTDYNTEQSPEVKAYVDAKWREENEKELAKTGKTLQNESLVSVSFVNADNGDLDVKAEEYKCWKTKAKKDYYQKFGNEDIPNPLNVQMLVKTTDDQFVLGPRPGKDVLQLPGGMLNVSDFRRTRLNNPMLVGAIREFNEEIAPIPVLNPSFLGTSFYAGRVLTTVFMSGQIEMSVEDLMEYRQENKDKIKDFNDFPTIESVGSSKMELETAIHTRKMQETAMIALLLYGYSNFGPKWLGKHCSPCMIATHLKEKVR